MRDSSRPGFAIGVVFAVVAVIGSVFFGWDFSGTSRPLPITIGVIAVVFTIRNR